ncbi:hypothetical protein [Nannocystis pusilla]|uniref:hypothetical protein n=1 Tax=Nannocystis pusilla TaxID=889268 RepID=UPI003DA31232
MLASTAAIAACMELEVSTTTTMSTPIDWTCGSNIWAAHSPVVAMSPWSGWAPRSSLGRPEVEVVEVVGSPVVVPSVVVPSVGPRVEVGPGPLVVRVAFAVSWGRPLSPQAASKGAHRRSASRRDIARWYCMTGTASVRARLRATAGDRGGSRSR